MGGDGVAAGRFWPLLILGSGGLGCWLGLGVWGAIDPLLAVLVVALAALGRVEIALAPARPWTLALWVLMPCAPRQAVRQVGQLTSPKGCSWRSL